MESSYFKKFFSGTKRFGELKKSIGKISQKVLTLNLREMEEMNLLKKVYPEIPPRVAYSLTNKGFTVNGRMM